MAIGATDQVVTNADLVDLLVSGLEQVMERFTPQSA